MHCYGCHCKGHHRSWHPPPFLVTSNKVIPCCHSCPSPPFPPPRAVVITGTQVGKAPIFVITWHSFLDFRLLIKQSWFFFPFFCLFYFGSNKGAPNVNRWLIKACMPKSRICVRWTLPMVLLCSWLKSAIVINVTHRFIHDIAMTSTSTSIIFVSNVIFYIVEPVKPVSIINDNRVCKWQTDQCHGHI